MNKAPTPTRRVTDEEVIARAQRAMNRASAKAMEDYKRFGIEPVVENSLKQDEEGKTTGR